LHKQPVEILRKIGAVDGNDCIDLDTGFIWLDRNIVTDLFSLISSNDTIDSEKFDMMVNDGARLSFYGDFLYSLADSAVYENYLASEGENPPNDKLLECRKAIWPVLAKYRMSLIRLSPAKFIHLGTTRELHKLASNGICESFSNSHIHPGTRIGYGCYIEDCYIGDSVNIGDNVILSNLNIENIGIPGDVVIHGLELHGNRYCARIYGINDNPKDSTNGTFFGGSLVDFAKNTGIVANDLWTTDIYPVCDSAREAIEFALVVYKLSKGIASDEEFDKWKMSAKTSLAGSFRNADVPNIFKWRSHLENVIRFCQK